MLMSSALPFLPFLPSAGAGAAAAAAAARAAASFCAGLSSTTLALGSTAGAAAFSAALDFGSGFFASACFAAAFPGCAAFAFSFEEWAAAVGLPVVLASFLEAGATGRLCFCVIENPTPEAYCGTAPWGRRRREQGGLRERGRILRK